MLESYFKEGGDKVLPTRYTKAAAQYLALSYYETEKWEDAIPYFEKAISDDITITYQGLALYRLQEDERAFALITKALAAIQASTGKQKTLLKNELLKAKIEIFSRKYPHQKGALLGTLKEYFQANRDMELSYIKKAGMLAKDLGDQKEAIRFFNEYLKKEATDSQVLDALLQLQNFHPLAHGCFWRYKVEIYEAGRQAGTISYIYFRIVEEKNGKYKVAHDGGTKPLSWYIAEGYLHKENIKVIPTPMSRDATWERKGYSVEFGNYNEIVKTEAGEFRCVVIIATSHKDRRTYVKEYYAPNVGEIKMERYVNGVKSFQRELVRYNIPEK
jgi:tetratricopeptide (TPR) repeat protein